MNVFTNLFGSSRSKEAWLVEFQKYTDKPEERTWRVLADLDDALAWERFPDFDIACIRAAEPIDKELPGEWDEALLKKGLEKCPRKSNLLFDLSANMIFQGKGKEAFITAIQAIHAAEAISPDPGNHVYPFYFLYAIFSEIEEHTYGIAPLTDLLKMHKPRINIHAKNYTLIVELAEKTCPQLDKNLINASETILREKLPERDRLDLFEAYS
jgi:hypothetical protein